MPTGVPFTVHEYVIASPSASEPVTLKSCWLPEVMLIVDALDGLGIVRVGGLFIWTAVTFTFHVTEGWLATGVLPSVALTATVTEPVDEEV